MRFQDKSRQTKLILQLAAMKLKHLRFSTSTSAISIRSSRASEACIGSRTCAHRSGRAGCSSSAKKKVTASDLSKPVTSDSLSTEYKKASKLDEAEKWNDALATYEKFLFNTNGFAESRAS